jgi:hypothetical protein
MHECAVLLPTSARVDINGRRGKQGVRGRSHRELGGGESEEARFIRNRNWLMKHVQRPRYLQVNVVVVAAVVVVAMRVDTLFPFTASP